MEDQLEIEFGGGGKRGTKKKMKNNKRRFSEEQVKWLETMFQNESKLEPRQKAEVASQLGLHPRQVAIWFQNKRARWKSKQLQQDYDALRRNYDALASRFELLKRENQSLSLQVQKLKELELVGNNTLQHNNLGVGVNDQESESNNNNDGGDEKKPGLATEGGSHHYTASMPRDEGTDYFGMEESTADLLAMVEPTCSSLTSDEEWHGLQSDGLFDQSPSSCEWWDFWC